MNKHKEDRKMYLDSAVNELNRAIKIFPEFADAYQQIGKIYLDEKDFAKADEYYKKAIGTSILKLLSIITITGTYFLISAATKKHDPEFETAIKWNATYADAYNNLASVYGTYAENLMKNGNTADAMKNYQLAVDNFKKAIDCDPEFLTPYKFLGITYRAMHDENDAQYYFGKFDELSKTKK